jgi:iron complex outermembrane receptor protein
MILIKHTILVGFLLVAGHFTHAQVDSCGFILTGTVADADEKTPLDNAYLYIKELDLRTETDNEGHYHFYKLCPGIYTFIISHALCDTLIKRIRIESNLVLNFKLPHQFKQLHEVKVSPLKELSTTVIKEELTEKDIAETRGQSLGNLLRRVNGVTVLQTGSTIQKPVIHGLHSQRILLVTNGIRLEGQQWGAEHAPEVDPYVADRFQVLKGAGAIRYGSDAIGGAVLIEPKPLSMDQRLKGEVHTGYFSNNRQYVVHAQMEQNSKSTPALSWRAHVTYKRGGTARTPNYWLQNTGLQEFNMAFLGAYRKPGYRLDVFLSGFSTQVGIFTGSHIGNLSDLQRAINSDYPLQNQNKFSYVIERPFQQVQHYIAKGKLQWSDRSGYRWQLSVAHQENNRSEYDRAMITSKPELSLSIGTSTLELLQDIKGKNQSTITWGLQGMYQQNVWSGSRYYIPNFRNWNLSIFGIHRAKLGKWNVESALRFDYRSLKTFRNRTGIISSASRQFYNPSATLTFSRALSPVWSFNTNTIFAWRAPQINELFVNGLHHGTANFEIGDSSFSAERSLKQLIEFVYQKGSVTSLSFTSYLNRIGSFINLVPSLPPILTLRGAYPSFRYVQVDALLYGGDIKFEQQLFSSLRFTTKGMLLWARNISTKDWLQQMPSHRFESELVYSFSSKHFQESYISPSVLWVTKQRRIPSGALDYLPPPPGYTIANLNMGTQLVLGQTVTHVQLGINNIFNTRFRDYMNRFRYFNDEVGRNVILQLNWKF